jgi:hypothetical protein
LSGIEIWYLDAMEVQTEQAIRRQAAALGEWVFPEHRPDEVSVQR